MRTIFSRRRRSARLPATDGNAQPGTKRSSACYAPQSALYMAPDGKVSACCATGFNAGSVTGPSRQSLRAIWKGTALAAQSQSLAEGSYDFGCQECEHAESAGGRSAALASQFDRFIDGAPHQFPQLIDFALSSRCNLQCVMCNGGLSSSIRTKREGLPPLPMAYDDRFFDELDEFLPHVRRVQFKGGEPFLAKENRRIWDRLIEQGLEPEATLTTNATIFNDNVEHYVRQLRIHPIISVDAMTAGTLESIRVGVDAKRLWENVDRFQAVTDSTGAGLTLSFCMMRLNWREALPLLTEADRREVNSNVIFVNQPAQYDLLRLPHLELREVHRVLAAARPSFTSPGHDMVWQEVLQRIASQIERPVELLVRSPPSAVTAALQPHRLDGAQQQRLRSSLQEAHGLPPLVIDLRAGVVETVEEPPWAGWLHPSTWVDHSLEGIEPLIAAAVGPLVVAILPGQVAGVDVVTLLINTPTRRRTVHVHRFFDQDANRQRVFLVEVGSAVDAHADGS